MLSSEWTPEELGETLYKLDENATGVINEIKQVGSSSHSEIGISDKKPLDHDPYYKSQESEPEYLKLDLQGDDVHIVEFYAPWCPHCQNFKSHYIDLAREIQRRTIATQIYFHAVSCTLNEIICDTYEIEGFPTVMGWRGGEDYANFNDITKPGLVLNEEGKIDADSVADFLLIALAEDEMANMTPESKFSNSQDQRQWEENKKQLGLEIAKEHLAMMEYEADINERYHNAAVSLAYLLKTSVYESSKGYLNEKKAHVLYDFLILVDWATPFQWDFRSQFIQVLLNRFNSDVIAGKRSLVDLVESLQGRSFKTGTRREELLWGHLNESRTKRFLTRRAAVKSGLGGEAESYEFHVPFQTLLKEHSQWTDACTHKTVSKGFTCGLWHLFHILTIGSIQFQNRMYGIHKGMCSLIHLFQMIFIQRHLIS
jgi:thiol-disulfide isomerase/thioredoxin